MSRFAREDKPELFIEYDSQLGWVALDPETGTVTGRPWDDELRHQHPDHPVECEWISKKGVKSYVYALRHVRQT
ncbi:hypothetical protein VVD49_17410 [Uliginosibacterium sp. H3]|uniref:DUF2283 domain-containing protein n=1 Tax=Uliginosibacterium silvisoli TaxID=3114758 RepID=A0ABU6K6K0_9RHOO|nr:hypothetical protein [Uliginosibacterium sp. H3]